MHTCGSQVEYTALERLPHCFRNVLRVKLIVEYMEKKRFAGGADLNIAEIVENGTALKSFPLHDWNSKATLDRMWTPLSVLPWNQPLWDIKNYFGEKVRAESALFVFTRRLFLPALCPLPSALNLPSVCI